MVAGVALVVHCRAGFTIRSSDELLAHTGPVGSPGGKPDACVRGTLAELVLQNAKALFGAEILQYHPSEASPLEKISRDLFLDCVMKAAEAVKGPNSDMTEHSSRRSWLLFLRHMIAAISPDFDALDLYLSSVATVLNDPQADLIVIREALVILVNCALKFHPYFSQKEAYPVFMPSIGGLLERFTTSRAVCSAIHFAICSFFALHGEDVFLLQAISVFSPSALQSRNVKPMSPRTVMNLGLMLQNPITSDELGGMPTSPVACAF